jgi:hypothetical protein
MRSGAMHLSDLMHWKCAVGATSKEQKEQNVVTALPGTPSLSFPSPFHAEATLVHEIRCNGLRLGPYIEFQLHDPNGLRFQTKT